MLVEGWETLAFTFKTQLHLPLQQVEYASLPFLVSLLILVYIFVCMFYLLCVCVFRYEL